ncbi:hypothetical protein MY4038_000955 [Beauveria bassiana]
MHNRSTSDATRGSHRISATPPIFPTYLLPSFKFPFLRRRVSASSSSSSASHPSSSPKTTSSPAGAGRLQRLGPDTLRCSACSADLALAAQIISKGFTGRYGRALLVAPPPPPPPATSAAEEDDYDSDSGSPPLLNIRIGRLENRQLVTGWHVVADISCSSCSRKLGWKYVDAKEKSQKYKVGKYILETERVTTHRSWGDEDGDDGASGVVVVDGGPYGTRRRMSSDRVSFDSEDDDECDDVFAAKFHSVALISDDETIRFDIKATLKHNIQIFAARIKYYKKQPDVFLSLTELSLAQRSVGVLQEAHVAVTSTHFGVLLEESVPPPPEEEKMRARETVGDTNYLVV